MRLKSGQKEYTRKIIAAHIKVAYLCNLTVNISIVYISNLIQLQGSVTEISRLLVPINFNGNHWIMLVRSKFVYAANGIGMKLVM